jgi:Protein of unknown function (DUF2853).
MSKKDDVIAACAADLSEKCGVAAPDMDLLGKIVTGLGPSVYNPDSALVSSSDPEEVKRFKTNYCINKLGVPEGEALDAAVEEAFETYGRSNPRKRRPVLCYLICVKFGKQAVYG